MAAETVREMTLVGIPYSQSGIDQTHARPQKFARVSNSNALKIGVRR